MTTTVFDYALKPIVLHTFSYTSRGTTNDWDDTGHKPCKSVESTRGYQLFSLFFLVSFALLTVPTKAMALYWEAVSTIQFFFLG